MEGLINTEAGAIDYASQLIGSSHASEFNDCSLLVAEERSGVWHISRRKDAEGQAATPILRFNRLDGRVLYCAE